MKDYPFKIGFLMEFEGNQITSYLTKGHHDKQKFVDGVKTEQDADVNIEWVHHSYGKWIPIAGEKRVTLLHEFDHPVKGSFPMTYIEVM